jgi:hypothetical protein
VGHWSDALGRLGACDEAREWAKTQPSAKVAWDACERADWALWILGRTDTSAPWSEERKPLVRCALACAADGLKYAKEGETKDAAEACISVTQAWCEGAATVKEVHEACSAADAAASSYAAYAADSAASAAASSYAAYAADSAASAAADSAASARSRVLRELCVIVRSHFPSPPRLP